jgi:predicted secreted hydrolase
MQSSKVASSGGSQDTNRRSFLGYGAALGGMALGVTPAMASSAAGLASASSPEFTTLVPPLFDPVSCLRYLPGVFRNSWFLIGYLETASGHKLNCLVHQIINSPPGEPVQIASILNITDITERTYRGEEKIHSAGEVSLDETRMRNVTPSSMLQGDHRAIHVQADFGWGALDLSADFPGRIMMNGGAGVFDFLSGTPTVQYSIPWGQGSGWLRLNGERHEVTGKFWFDRQWGQLQGLLGQAGRAVGPHDNWAWMDLNLSNGVALGLWDIQMNGQRFSWVTALHPDGTHVVAAIEPLAKDASAIWTSPASGQKYPTRFKVRIPALDCTLDVAAVMEAQEIVSPTEPKYEGVATVSGVYGGKSVTGFTLIELMGDWRG